MLANKGSTALYRQLSSAHFARDVAHKASETLAPAPPKAPGQWCTYSSHITHTTAPCICIRHSL